ITKTASTGHFPANQHTAIIHGFRFDIRVERLDILFKLFKPAVQESMIVHTPRCTGEKSPALPFPALRGIRQPVGIAYRNGNDAFGRAETPPRFRPLPD